MDYTDKSDPKPSGSPKDRSENGSKQQKMKKDVNAVKLEGSFKRTFLEHLGIKRGFKSPLNQRKMLDRTNIEPDIKIKSSTLADAAVFKPADKETDQDVIKETLEVVNKYAEEYNMNNKRRGMAIILNHEHFERDDPREGTKKDVEKLEHTLSLLKFDINVYNDLDYSSILTLLRELSKEDHSDCDCIAFFVLTHGNKKREISAKDLYYPIDKLWENFSADNCLTLAGKPKLFFINACRGKKKDVGIKFFQRGRTESDSSRQESYKIPKHADFLIAQSSVDGFLSYRDRFQGTWFIQCLCDALLELHNEKDLLKILTVTARKIAVDFRTISDYAVDCDLTQVSSFTSMLIRDVYLRTK